MPKLLRFTGQNPPVALWQEYPNWRNALEEEGEEDQDETTLMPHEVQTHIDSDAAFTAGTVRLNNGREFPAFIAVSRNEIHGCEVYEMQIPWRIYFASPKKKWVPFRAEWLPEAERPPSVSFEDSEVFPLEIQPWLPWRPGEPPRKYRIDGSGQMQEM